MKIYDVQHFWELHREGITKTFGGSVGIYHGINHYWDNLTEADFIQFAMGSLGTLWYTFLGVSLAWILNKYIFKTKK